MVSAHDSASVDSPYPVILPRHGPGHLRGGAAGTRGARLVPGLPLRRLAPRRGLRGRPERPLHPGALLQAGRPRVDRLRHPAVALDREPWTQFVEGSTPRELALFGFPGPGHPIWTDELLDETAKRYPKLDLSPWREALAESGR